jgi:FAD/FMN-containing dehydrogenase/Fe-S oxidoreductase
MNSTQTLIQRLQSEIRGEILTDAVSLGLYATDASMYQIMPLAVVVPLDRVDAVRVVRLCGELHVPILARGGGTSLSGQTIAEAVVLDFSKHMHRLLEVNTEERWARIEPGIVRDELNVLLKAQGLQFAPDPATANRANVGGMIANNSGGMRSLRYGTTIDHVLELDVALPTGEVLNLRALDEAEYDAKCALRDREGDIYRGLREIITTHGAEIEARYSKARRRSGGYMFDHFLKPGPWNLCKLISASEGTLGVVLEAKVNLELLPKASGLCVSHFATMGECLRAVGPLVDHAPTSVEMLDDVIINLARESLLGRELCHFVEGSPAAILITEFQGDTAAEVEAPLQAMVRDLEARGLGYRHKLMCGKQEQADVWAMRKNGLGLMTTIKGDRKPVPFIEDAAVPLDHLPEYIEAVLSVCAKHGNVVSIYAHAGVGLIHVRPMLDLHRREDIDLMKQIADEVFELVMLHKGALSGEHGDGLVRGGFNERYFGPRIYAAFKQIKQIFDPLGLMNPGKIVDTPPMDQHLRFGHEQALPMPRHEFHYRADDGLLKAVEQCTGVGACRKTLDGVMCPSYIATRDEEHSTRGRANALRLALTGQLGRNALGSDRLRDVFDLCLSCKACKSECPNSVDMAKLKAEFQHAYHQANGIKLRERMFAHAHASAKLASGALAPLANTLLKAPPVRWALDRFIGIDARRPLPRYARQRLSTWFAARQAARGAQPAGRPQVALFNDTYIEHHHPHIGRAAIEVLEALGYEVRLVSAGCCQRPAISKGLLDEAKLAGTQTLRNLDVDALQNLPILVVEPSCASALADDLPDLVDDEALGRRVGSRVVLVDDFLAVALLEKAAGLPWKSAAQLPRKIHVHGHCHQKSLFKMEGTLGMLRAIPGAEVGMIDAGCCGMAGSFGYEKEHYELSLKVGEDRLFPALRQTPTSEAVVANGFSCRHQIADVVHREARHAVEIVRDALLL